MFQCLKFSTKTTAELHENGAEVFWGNVSESLVLISFLFHDELLDDFGDLLIVNCDHPRSRFYPVASSHRFLISVFGEKEEGIWKR